MCFATSKAGTIAAIHDLFSTQQKNKLGIKNTDRIALWTHDITDVSLTLGRSWAVSILAGR